LTDESLHELTGTRLTASVLASIAAKGDRFDFRGDAKRRNVFALLC